MDITPELAAHIADLAQLELSPSEIRETAAELERLLEYMDVLSRLDAVGAEPISQVLPVKNVFRDDMSAPSLERPELLAAAPASDGEAFLVPRTVE